MNGLTQCRCHRLSEEPKDERLDLFELTPFETFIILGLSPLCWPSAGRRLLMMITITHANHRLGDGSQRPGPAA
ncbi:hypothetical protein EVAR_80136_1 [Eumeta japonica]|uniref:Uncharacterized protein n=1 Tax=Eumeta variegata TaxID=151549 RepID=A0A4C1YHU4_EUMVA|nr:hypothetical protein EVAR_80136_1 [Eumeta japonica]